jgi:hypothetical protein
MELGDGDMAPVIMALGDSDIAGDPDIAVEEHPVTSSARAIGAAASSARGFMPRSLACRALRIPG